MASYEVVNKVGVITCQNPPVNALSYNLRLGLFDGLAKANGDSDVIAIVICADHRSFPAGADISEFSNGKAFKKPIIDFIRECEANEKPVVAAIHGTALGGGLEVALGCHYRVGTSNCKVGFPEVNLGLLPGAGGTQRLPRLIGPMIAAEMIVSGQMVKAQRALKVGILDKVVHIEANHKLSMERTIIRQAAIRYAIDIADKPVAPRRVCDMKAFDLNPFFYDTIRQSLKKKARGFIAPELNLQAVAASHTEPTFEAGMKKERDLFMKLATGPQSSALQHIFFAQRQISKVPGIDSKKAKKIGSVGIIGCGTMGGGILMNFVQKGIPVVVLEMKQEYLDRGLAVVKGNWERQLKRGKISKAKLEKFISLIKPTTNYDDLSDVDIIIEAVFENTEVKRKVFTELDRVAKPGAILATNTSFLDVGKIASFTSRPNKVVGTHFFAPANQMQLLENIRHDGTDEETIATVQEMAKQIGKKGVLARVCPGFIGNRMFAVEATEAARILEEGAMPAEVDKALYDFGWAMGIFNVGDLSGLDIGYRRRDEFGYVKDPSKRPVPDYYPETVADKLVEMGRLGMKTGKGWFDYDKKRRPQPNKMVEQMIVDNSRAKGIIRRCFSSEEIIARLMHTFVNEGFKILEEGIAIRPSDIDVVFVFGYGFPAYRGGPMHWADSVGLKKVLSTVQELNRKYPKVPHFVPSKLLEECVAKKTTLAKLWRKKEKANRSKL